MKPNLNQNSQDSLNLAHVDTTLVTTRDSLGLASENMVFSPRIPLSGQIPLSKSGSTDSGASDVLRNLLSKDDDVVSKIENLSTIYEEMYRSTSTTSDVSTTVLESPSFIVDRTADNPLEATVNENLDTYMDLKGQSNPLELSTILCEDVLLCDKSEISVYSNPILDLTPVILDSEKAKSTLSQEIDNLGTYDKPDGFSDSSELRRSLSEKFPPCSDIEISWKSIPTLDLTPTVLNDVTTPNISKSSISSSEKLPETETETENLSESESTERILLDAGYAITEIKDMMTLKKNTRKVDM